MCWKIAKKDFDKNPEKYHRVADKDIVVYKFGNRTDNKFNPICRDRYGYSRQVFNKEVELVLEETDDFFDKTSKIINEGYHSYAEEYFNFIDAPFQSWLSEVTSISNCDTIGEFIIPKGTEYYENPFGEIVSSNIIWTGESISINSSITECANKFKDLNICVGE